MLNKTSFTAEQKAVFDDINTVVGQLRDLENGTPLPNNVSVSSFVDEVMEHWAPEAEKLGLEHLQKELLDKAVKIGYPEDYDNLKTLLIESEAMCENVFKTFALPIRAMLDDLGIEYEFLYRMKSVYSIWREMRIDHKQFDDVYDLFATRIVYKVPGSEPASLMEENCVDCLDEVKAVKDSFCRDIDLEKFYCWRIYNVISMLFRIHPDRIKNWITYPKPSGYQALQLTVMGPDCNWIELQIRSERMNYEAEYGIAAHWKYKAETAVK